MIKTAFFTLAFTTLSAAVIVPTSMQTSEADARSPGAAMTTATLAATGHACDAAFMPWLPRTLQNDGWVRSAGQAADDRPYKRAAAGANCTVV